MLYKFKSPVEADLIMLPVNAEELLGIIGKSPGPTGIVTAAQAGAAIAALRAEIERRETQTDSAQSKKANTLANATADDVISLRHRATPFIKLLEQTSAAGKDVVWGV